MKLIATPKDESRRPIVIDLGDREDYSRVQIDDGPYAATTKESLISGPTLVEQITELRKKLDDLKAFKAFVHRRLDEMKIPTHPEGPHSKEGCRVGDRLDIVENLLNGEQDRG